MSPYVDLSNIAKELEFARLVFRQGRFSVIDMTDKAIEDSANEVINLVKRRVPNKRDS
jgi:regulator of PEP synthase PpsR (kinase-PPPase family)